MKNTKNMTTEELLELVGDCGVTATPEIPDIKPNRVERFIKDWGITAGNDPVPNYIIFYTYYKVYEPTSRKKLSKIDFFRKFNKYFTSARTGKERKYLLDSKVFSKDKSFYEKAKAYNKKYNNRKKREADQERQRKASSTIE